MQPTTLAMIRFVQSIGLTIQLGTIPSHKEFLPGICIENGGLRIDIEQLKYPGDILHEAGHLAVATPEDRAQMDGVLNNEDWSKAGAEEMMAIAWSYAAALFIGIEPSIVLHDHGYKNGGKAIAESFGRGESFGVPMLEWVGMTKTGQNAINAGVQPYPNMLHWVRQ